MMDLNFSNDMTTIRQNPQRGIPRSSQDCNARIKFAYSRFCSSGAQRGLSSHPDNEATLPAPSWPLVDSSLSNSPAKYI